MRILFVEPFFGGSHRLFAERFRECSRHQVELLTLPASFWKWRMRGAHLALADKVRERIGAFDGFLSSDMLSLAELKGAVPALAELPCAVYFHENQVNYPVPRGEAPDVHFGFTNLSTALAADRLIFNSEFHRRTFLEGVGPFVRAMPDHRPKRLADRLRPKAEVVFPGVDCDEISASPPARQRSGPLRLLWNHRWEFDKQPEVFFAVLERLAAGGLDFRVHILGENFQVKPKVFLEAREKLGERIESFGFLPDRGRYLDTLYRSDVVVSTAIQEFYGIAVMEAVLGGCRPLLPGRLVYPELYGEECCYGDDGELEATLRRFLTEGLPGAGGEELRRMIRERHDVRRSAALLDDILEGMGRRE